MITRKSCATSPEDLARRLGDIDLMVGELGDSTSETETVTVHPGMVHIPADQLRFVLLDLRKHVRSAPRRATTERESSQMREVVEQSVSDPDARRKLEDRIEQASAAVAQAAASERERDATFEIAMKREDQALEGARWKLWWSLLQREPIAVLIGAFLMVGFSVVLVVAMFTDTNVPEVMFDTILLISGFFFGRSAAGGRGGQDES